VETVHAAGFEFVPDVTLWHDDRDGELVCAPRPM
jgi:hypothetical protein